ncbi:hypothetical protein PPERSA_05441 [Pseudocohnilembus persalinus]|uniref:Tetratricopeptide repeat protein n=1 Tax=Pseudocohnilembus persalinus TaxID=266149 RepID=A0A0V0R800_PSEPJ|nr:hypothetical protein PPERSA_05441 [Pseudocohnilembus persalinus]|eukprot:KRX10621.1 hypothetical protein PPERSA_05441 [Pseudocohnilembus persalinus]
MDKINNKIENLENKNEQQNIKMLTMLDQKIPDEFIVELIAKVDIELEKLGQVGIYMIEHIILKCYLIQLLQDQSIVQKINVSFEESVIYMPRIKSLLNVNYYKNLEVQPYRMIGLLEVYLLRIQSQKFGLNYDELIDEINDWLGLFEMAEKNEFLRNKNELSRAIRKIYVIVIARLASIQNQVTDCDTIKNIIVLYNILKGNYVCKHIDYRQQLQQNNIENQKQEQNKIKLEFGYLKNRYPSVDTQIYLLYKICSYMLIFVGDKNQDHVKYIKQYLNGFYITKPTKQGNFETLEIGSNIQENCQNMEQLIMVNLAIIHESTPFDDSTLSMKACVQLYEAQEYSKLYQLIHIMLSQESIQNHPFKSVILAMSSIFTGIKLGKSEEGLAMSRLNLRDFDIQQQNLHQEQNEQQKKDKEQKQFLIDYETRLSHLGYSYYNLYRYQTQAFQQSGYMVKAIEYLSQSCHNNYLANFTLARCYAIKNQLDLAQQHVVESLKLNKNYTQGFLLLAQIYTSKQQLPKADIIINKLLEDEPDKPLLLIFKAYLETEKYLLSNQQNQSLDYAQEFGKGTLEYLLQERLKGGKVQQIIKLMMQGLLKTINQENDLITMASDLNSDFMNLLPKLSSLHDQNIDSQKYIDYKNQGQLLEQRDQDYESAYQQYEEILREDYYNFKTMVQLATLLIREFQNDKRKIERAYELLITASKVEENAEICFGFGQMYQIQGDLERSNHYLIKALKLSKSQPILGFSYLPDQLFTL